MTAESDQGVALLSEPATQLAPREASCMWGRIYGQDKDPGMLKTEFPNRKTTRRRDLGCGCLYVELTTQMIGKPTQPLYSYISLG